MILDKAEYYHKLNNIIINAPAAVNSSKIWAIIAALVLLLLFYLLWKHLRHKRPKNDYVHKLGTASEILVIVVIFVFMCMSWCNHNELTHDYVNAKFDKELITHNQSSSELIPVNNFYNSYRF